MVGVEEREDAVYCPGAFAVYSSPLLPTVDRDSDWMQKER